MTYAETLDFLFESLPVWEQKGADAYKPGLNRMREFSSESGDPARRFRAVHVAGTNGKGSVSHMLAAVLQSAGYRTGLFTSPHLVDFRERIRVDGETIPREAVVEFAAAHRDRMLQLGLTFFEMTTAMAFDWFARSGCDVAVIEAGLGGRLDSTNIVTPALSVITNVGLEHTQYLGTTVAAIAAEKAGIIKQGVPVVVGETDPESEPVFRARAKETGSEIVFADKTAQVGVSTDSDGSVSTVRDLSGLDRPYGTRDDRLADTARSCRAFRLDLAGDYQQKNLATVLAAVDVLRRTFDIPDDALRKGLAGAATTTGLRGRWEVLGHSPLVVCDTAHNAHGFRETAGQIARQKFEELYMVLGFARDKDLGAIIELLPRGAHYVLTQANVGRAMPAEELKEVFAAHGIGGASVEVAGSVAQAVGRALSLAAPGDMIYIGGSNFVVGELLTSPTYSTWRPTQIPSRKPKG